MQSGDLFAGLKENPFADGDDEAGLFGEGNECVWTDEAELGAVPAKEGFDTEKAAVDEGDLRLIEDLELLIFEGSAQG